MNMDIEKTYAFAHDGGLGNLGMTMRQYYKAAAITGLAANAVYNDTSYPEMAMVAGVIADALLAEDATHTAAQKP